MKRLSLLLLTSPALFAYNYYYTDAFSSINGNWTQNGSLTPNSPGLTSGGSGSVISTISVPYTSPATPGMYEVNATFNFAVSGGTYIAYLDASSNALSGSSGTFYSVELTPTISGGACSATMNINRSVSGSITTLYSATVGCSTNTNLRAVRAQGSVIVVYINNNVSVYLADGTITSGQPGVGVSNTPSGNSLVSASLGQLDVTAPNPVSSTTIRTSPFPNQVNIEWQNTSDNSDGVGVAFYLVYRYYNGNWTFLSTLGALQDTFTDNTVSPNTSYVYGIFPYDFHMNAAGTGVSVTTPPSGAVDPRRVGVRGTGAYWGASPEQIDVLSGNVSYSLPLLQAKGRSASVGFALSYNSQNWRQDGGGVWNLGDDVGYGYGWSLQAGSLTPYWNGYFLIDHYTFTDATGAQYQLTVNNSNVWTSTQSIYISYDANAQILHFPDGTFWVFGCESAGTEQDSGTYYPTTMEDTNGNQINITYANGLGVSGINSSARITSIEDVRAKNPQSVYYTYAFTYNCYTIPTCGGTIPHLIQITNSINTGEVYNFSYSPFTLTDPFTSTSFGASTALSQVTLPNDNNASYQLTADASGQLVQATTIYGGHINWSYSPFTYLATSTPRTQMEVTSRTIYDGYSTSPAYTISHEAGGSNETVHAQTAINDAGGVGQKFWAFYQGPSNPATIGLVTTYKGNDLSQNRALIENDFIWNQDTAGNNYIGQVTTTHDPGTSNAISSYQTQTLDIHGNVTQVIKHNYPGFSPATLTYNYSYLYQDPTIGYHYSALNIYNRLTSATVTDGTTNAGLAGIAYDYNCNYYLCIPGAPASDVREWDTSYSGNLYRGNPTSISTPSGLSTIINDWYGNVTNTTMNGVTSTVSNTSATNYSAPSQITVGSLTTSLQYNDTFLGLTNESGPNGTSVSIGYDLNARPNSTTSPFGATTSTFYNDTASPPNTCTAVDGRWTQTILDGFGRPIRTYTGNGSACGSGTFLTQTEMNYAPCGCSPLGKLTSQSVPHAYGTTANAWTIYGYDGIGRTYVKYTAGSDAGNYTAYNYFNGWVQVNDAGGSFKYYFTDGFGNLVVVTEPDPGGATVYSYDPLGHLTGVLMPRPTGTQTRTFSYSGNFLMSATNPENGTVTYAYNNAYSKVSSRTDAKGQVTLYTYDGYARLTTVQRYPSGTNNPEDACQHEDYFYDGNNPIGSSYPQYAAGHLSAVRYWGGYTFNQYPAGCDTTFVELYTYLAPGAPVGKQLYVARGAATLTLTATFTYDTEGRMIQEIYPTDSYGTTAANLSYTFDSMGRLNIMTDNLAGGQQIIQGVNYGPANEILSITGGSYSNAWGGETRSYNSIKQLTIIDSKSYSYPYWNIGKITSESDAVSGETVTYTYDSLNRLATADNGATASPAWGQSFAYDGFGNLTNVSVIRGSAPTLTASYDPNTNHAGSEDANGNPGTVPLPASGSSASATYDVENRLVAISQGYTPVMFYSYAPGNKRVWRGNWTNSGGTWTRGATDELTFWSVNGQKLTTYQLYVSGSTIYAMQTGANLYFGGKLIKNANGWVSSDRLGSIGKFYPYGAERPSATTNGTEKFTGYFRDAESGNDYAVNRYMSPGWGRFITPDPSGSRYAKASNPASWNMYAYVKGDPINRRDSHGLDGDDPGVDCEGSRASDCIDFCMTADGLIDQPGPDCDEGGGGGGDDGGGSAPAPTCTLAIYTRPLSGTLGRVLWYKATHSYIVISEDGAPVEEYDALHSGKLLTGEDLSVPIQGYGAGNNPESATNLEDGLPVSIPCSDIQALIQDTTNFNNSGPVTYHALGPNSNSYLHWLLNQIGLGSTAAPPGAYGWNTSIPGV